MVSERRDHRDNWHRPVSADTVMLDQRELAVERAPLLTGGVAEQQPEKSGLLPTIMLYLQQFIYHDP